MKQAFAPLQLKITLTEAAVAALAAGVALLLGVPIWAMFLGWNAYFTRGAGLKSGLVNLGCVLIGVGLGMTAQGLVRALPGAPGPAEQIGSVFGVTLVVLSLRFLPRFNNIPGFFLGLVAYFASGLDPSFHALGVLGTAAVLGSTAGWLTTLAQARWVDAGSPAIADTPAPT